MIWIQQHAELLFCLVGCMLVTVIPRVGPVMYLHAESLPDLLRHWLSFVPVAVMAALLGPDVFIYQGEFMPTHHNLFLMTAIPGLVEQELFRHHRLFHGLRGPDALPGVVLMAHESRPHCPFHLREAHLPPALRKPRKPAPPLPPPARSARLLVRLAAEDTALFRFLLEGYDNTAYFTVLEPRTALLKLVFSPHREEALRRALGEMAESLEFSVEPWPLDRA